MFRDVKVGDTLYYKIFERSDGFGYNGESFTIPTKVIKVTNTQFVCDNYRRYRKQDGAEIGGEGYGRGNISISGEDQTEKRIEFLNKVKKLRLVKDILFELDKNRNALKIKHLSNISDSLITELKGILILLNKEETQ